MDTPAPSPNRDRWHRIEGGISLARPRVAADCVRFRAEPSTIEVDIATSALVVIDMQNDFLHPKGWFAARGIDISPLSAPIAAINRVAGACRDRGMPVVHLNWGVRADTAGLPACVLDKASNCGELASYGDAMPQGRVLVSGDWGAASVPEIAQMPQDLAVDKYRLSGFRDNALDQILRRRGITTLFFTGVNIDRCVYATLMDGAFLGYDPIVLTDACATVSPPYVEAAVLYLIRLLYGFTATTADLLEALTPSLPLPANGVAP